MTVKFVKTQLIKVGRGMAEILPEEYGEVWLGRKGTAVWADNKKSPVLFGTTNRGFCGNGETLYYYHQVSGGAVLKEIPKAEFKAAWEATQSRKRLLDFSEIKAAMKEAGAL